MLASATDERSHGFDALTVPCYTRQKSPLRPATISIHDDSNMVRNRLGGHCRRARVGARVAAQNGRQQGALAWRYSAINSASLAANILSTSEIVLSVNFWT